MTTAIRKLLLTILFFTALSCTDLGDAVNYLKVVELQPTPNSTSVDKTATIHIRLNRGISVEQGNMIQLRYVDDSEPVNGYAGCGLTLPVEDQLCHGPYIWKPGRTVEVNIQKGLSDPEGNTLKDEMVYRFTIAQDTVPFDLIDAQPTNNDTVSIGQSATAFGFLRFSDYLLVRDFVLTITPPASLRILRVVVQEDGRLGPSRYVGFVISELHPFTTYTITIPHTIKDFEGETLPHDYHLAFHTKP
ncbi:MAG: hypothetical protein AAB393_18735 [Bacteroidota bacterium]